MQLNQVAEAIARKEGHRSKSRIEDLKNVLTILSDLSYKSKEPITAIVSHGINRAKKAKRNAKS